MVLSNSEEISGVMYYEVGGMRLDRFMDSLGLKRSDATDTDNGRVMDFTNGTDIFTVIESDNHSRWMISGMTLRLSRTLPVSYWGGRPYIDLNWFMVYQRGRMGLLSLIIRVIRLGLITSR